MNGFEIFGRLLFGLFVLIAIMIAVVFIREWLYGLFDKLPDWMQTIIATLIGIVFCVCCLVISLLIGGVL